MKEDFRVTEQEFDRLQREGVATFFDCPNLDTNSDYTGFGGFFESESWCKRKDIILCCTNDGYFLRAREDLQKSKH